MSAATARQERVTSAATAADPYAVVCELVDRQQAALVAELPDMADAAGMRPVEMWFVWGALSEMLDDDVGRVEQALSNYLRRRHRRSADPADEMASAVRQACTVSNALVDGMVLAGRQVVSRGTDNRCFLAAALFLRYAHTPAVRTS